MTMTLTKPNKQNSTTSLRRLSLTAGLAGFLTVPSAFSFTDQRATFLPARQLLLNGSIHVSGVTGHVAEEFHNGISDRFPLNILALMPFSWMPERWAIAFAAMPWVMLTVWLLGKYYGHKVALIGACCTPLVFVGREFWPQTIAIPLLLLLANSKDKRVHVLAIVALAALRPPIALLGACLSLFNRRRILLPALSLAASVVLLLVYTRYFFGHYGLAGAYNTDKRTPVLHALYVGILSPQRGILFYCPWLLFIRKRENVTPFDRPNLMLLTTACYTLGEWFTYDAWGGNGYLGFRYALPFVVMAIPFVKTAPSYLFGWSAGIAAWLLLFDDYGFTNEARNPNIMEHPVWVLLAGVSGILLMVSRNLTRENSNESA